MRLTKTIRNQTLDNLQKQIFQPKRQKLLDRYEAILQKVADSQYPAKVREWMASMPKEAQGAFKNLDTAHLRIKNSEGRYTTVGHEILREGSPVKAYWRGNRIGRPTPRLFQDYSCNNLDLDKSPAGLKAALKAMHTLVEQELATRQTVMAALGACNTVKQLQENYPDLLKFLPEPEVVTNLPAVTNDKVTEMLQKAVKA